VEGIVSTSEVVSNFPSLVLVPGLLGPALVKSTVVPTDSVFPPVSPTDVDIPSPAELVPVPPAVVVTSQSRVADLSPGPKQYTVSWSSSLL